MKRTLLTSCFIILLMAQWIQAQQLQRIDLLTKKFSIYLHPDSKPGWIEFRNDAPYTAAHLFEEQPDLIGLRGNLDEMRILNVKTDPAGNSHFRYGQFYKGVRVEMIEQLVHEKKGRAYLANGDFIADLDLNVNATIVPSAAVEAALKVVPAEKYLWENATREADFKKAKNDAHATLKPHAELLIIKKDAKGVKEPSNYELAYRVAVFAEKPWAAKYVYIDAQTGNVIRSRSLDVFCSSGTAQTTFNGTQTVQTKFTTTACDFDGDIETSYFSWDDCNPDTEIKSWYADSFSGDDYYKCDGNNDWTTTGSSRMTITSLWSAKKAYNYFLNTHGHESFDGDDGLIDLFSNRKYTTDGGAEYCSNANYTNIIDNLNFGAGSDCTSGTTDDFNTLDIVGHEYTHGIIEYAHFDALDYSDESGALNESFADIFGEMVENNVEGSIDWMVGGDKSDGELRSFSDPKSDGQPDTYLGTNWESGDDDNGGVHTNSGVQNFVFFLLANGGSGTNDLGWEYNVTSIGWESARDIAWQAMMNYLDGDDGYITARNAWIQSAKDLFGSCSQEVISVGEAFMAVGVTHYTPYNLASLCGTYATVTSIDAAEEVRNATVFFNNFLTDCNTTINSGAIVTVESGNLITFHPGFTSLSGSLFTAFIDKCEMSDYNSGDLKNETVSEGQLQASSSHDLTISIYPNPAGPFTTIEFDWKNDTPVELYIMDVTGRVVQSVLKNEVLDDPHYRTEINTTGFSNGLFVCVMKSGNESHIQKFLVQH
ncbi:MAG: M4 family metallopeptidase [Chitinophagaceae bacterium]|nr:M4 family metallopeptidase [Chitinophagaceae bacterium]